MLQTRSNLLCCCYVSWTCLKHVCWNSASILCGPKVWHTGRHSRHFFWQFALWVQCLGNSALILCGLKVSNTGRHSRHFFFWQVARWVQCLGFSEEVVAQRCQILCVLLSILSVLEGPECQILVIWLWALCGASGLFWAGVGRILMCLAGPVKDMPTHVVRNCS